MIKPLAIIAFVRSAWNNCCQGHSAELNTFLTVVAIGASLALVGVIGFVIYKAVNHGKKEAS